MLTIYKWKKKTRGDLSSVNLDQFNLKVALESRCLKKKITPKNKSLTKPV